MAAWNATRWLADPAGSQLDSATLPRKQRGSGILAQDVAETLQPTGNPTLDKVGSVEEHSRSLRCRIRKADIASADIIGFRPDDSGAGSNFGSRVGTHSSERFPRQPSSISH